MKYIFDVDEKNNKLEIKLEISMGTGPNTNAYQIIECTKDSPNWNRALESLITDIIDNMRLTVKERQEAYENSNILIGYLAYNPHPQAISDQVMIMENGDPAVMNNKYELL